jgi:hypothetical protein
VSSQVFYCSGTQGAAVTFDLTLAPGARRGLVLFDELSAAPADAVAAAARFGATPDPESELFAGLSAADLAALANWTFDEQEPAPGPGPAPRDSVAPDSAASGPATSRSSTWPVAFSASDVGDGVGSVELFVKRPGATEYAAAGRVPGQQSGTLAFNGADEDGAYSFYTVATDLAGNTESAPATADAVTVVDRSKPGSSAGSPAFTRHRTFRVRYAVRGDTGTEPASVELFVRKPGASPFVSVDTDAGAGLDGRFAFTAARQGRYRFYTVATDAAGNREAVPARADSVTRVDRTAPTVERRMGAGPVRFDLGEQTRPAMRMWVSERGTTAFVIRQHGRAVRRIGPAETRRGLVTWSWDLRDDAGDRIHPGRYVLVLKAADRAGNRTTVRTPMRLVR